MAKFTVKFRANYDGVKSIVVNANRFELQNGTYVFIGPGEGTVTGVYSVAQADVFSVEREGAIG
ncbi:hypothetical protein GCM10027414_07210 [Humibacter ginsengiterrae]